MIRLMAAGVVLASRRLCIGDVAVTARPAQLERHVASAQAFAASIRSTDR